MAVRQRSYCHLFYNYTDEVIALTPEQEKLVIENMKLAYFAANQYYLKFGLEQEEAVSLAFMGLVKAATIFDEAKKAKFSTLAMKCMYNTFLQDLRNRSKQVETISFDSLVSEDSDTTYADLIPDEDNPYSYLENREMIESCLRELTVREQEIVTAYLADPNQRQVHLSKKFGISRQRISIIINKFKDKCRNYMQNR